MSERVVNQLGLMSGGSRMRAEAMETLPREVGVISVARMVA